MLLSARNVTDKDDTMTVQCPIVLIVFFAHYAGLVTAKVGFEKQMSKIHEDEIASFLSDKLNLKVQSSN
jgi:hypothetical protein